MTAPTAPQRAPARGDHSERDPLRPGRRVVRTILGAALLLAAAVSLTPLAAAQQPPQPPQPMGEDPTPGVIISVNGIEARRMSTGKRIRNVAITDPTRVNVVVTSPNEVRIVGLAPGISRVTLTDEDGKKDVFDVLVVAFDIRQLENVLRRAVPTANIKPVPAGNSAVILSGTVDRAEDLQLVLAAAQSVVGGVQVINAIRVGGVQQVQLDVVVAQVSRSELRAMSYNFLANSQNFFLGSTVGQAVVNPAIAGVTSSTLTATGFPAQVLSGAPGFPNGLPTNFLVGVLHDNWGFLQFLQALRTEGVLKLLSEPKLVTMSGRQASFLSGGEQAIPVPAGLGQVGVQFEEFGTRLNFIPIVLGNGKIHLEVEPEVSALDPAAGTIIGGTAVPGRSTQRVRTTVELEPGQTFVIGGLIQHTVTGNTIKVPILGDLPFVGAAFSNKTMNETETEVLVMVTPHLVDAMDCSQYPAVLPGQETRSPDDFELFLEGILEAPRGPRQVCHGKTYVPAYKNGPTSALFPCAGNDGCHGAGWGGPLCPDGCVGGAAMAVPAMTEPAMPGPAMPVKAAPVKATPAEAESAVPPPSNAPKAVSIREDETEPSSEAIGALPAVVPPAELPAPGALPALETATPPEMP